MDATVTPIESYLKDGGQHFRDKHFQERESISNKLLRETSTPPSTLFRKAQYRKPSSAHFLSLDIVDLCKFNTNQAAASTFLIMRTLETPYMVGNCIAHVVEDHLGSIIFLQLHNYIVKEKELADYFPIGTVMIVKEPFCELVNEGIAIRVDHPTDVIVIRSCDELYQPCLYIKWKYEIDESKNPLLAEPKPSNAEEWKKRGDDLFDAKNFYSAEVAYKLCITEANKCLDETVKSFAMNDLIFVYLELERFDQAVEMAEKVLEQHPNDSNTLFGLGCAYYELREYSKAEKYFEMSFQADPKDADNYHQLLRARLRLDEQSTGNYYMEQLYQQSKDKKLLDVADYVGAVDIKKMDGKSVGVVAKQDIEPGTLLVVSKAFQVSSKRESDRLVELPADFEHQQVTSAICTAVHKNFKTFGKQIYELLPPTVEQRYCYHNPENRPQPILDAFELINLSHTYTRLIMNEVDPCDTDEDIVDQAKAGCAFFTFPCHIKHSCLPNCGNIIYGNVMIIRALWPISKGEEITISHVHPFRKSYETHQQLFERLNYTCACLLCDFERQEGENAQSLRKEYVDKLRKSLAHALDVKCDAAAVRAKSEYINDILSTCNGRKTLNTDLFQAYLGVADSYLDASKCIGARTNVILAINCLGFQWDDLKKLASFAEGHNSSAVELKGKVFVGEELIKALELLTRVFIKDSFFLQHFAEAEMVVILNNYLVRVVYGDMKMKRFVSKDTDQLAHLIRSHKRTGNRKRSLS